MKKLTVCSLIATISLFASEVTGSFDETASITDNTSSQVEKINEENKDLVTLNKERNVKVLNLEFIQQKINEQNGVKR